VGDTARQGALRFTEREGSPFLAIDTPGQIPPLVALPELLSAILRYTADKETRQDLRLLLAPGSSLGGARPKASVIDRDGALAIAKFPHHDDEIRTEIWEALALTLAAKAGIPTPAWRLEGIGDKTVLIVRRFDRHGATRVPFLSAMSMLNAADNESHSYMEIADALRQHGSKASQDCAQLWRRIVFNILISNSEDHLRNHGFLYEAGGWRLSPAYDLNPVPVDEKPRVLTTTIDEMDGTASMELAFEVAGYFGLKRNPAMAIAAEAAHAVRGWRNDAKAIGLSPREIERMESAFEHGESVAAG
jgi:serine/threonine-protein kinase HipA